MKKYMKLLLTFLISVLIPLSIHAKVTIQKGNNSTQYSINIEKVSFEEIDYGFYKYLKARLHGVGHYQSILYKIGYPEIPVIRMYVTCDDSKDIQINFSKSWEMLAPISKDIMPSQPPIPKIRGAKTAFVRNMNFANQDMFWPERAYSIVDSGSIRGKKQKLITLFPFSYNAKTKEYKLRRTYTVNVYHDENEENDQKGPDRIAFIVGAKYKDSPALKSYIDFKKTLGFEITKLVVGADVNTPDDIRNKLKSLLNKNDRLKHALIIGDSEDVPGQRSTYCSGVTDHYYRAIDTDDYHTDINGPDIGVGRLTVKNENELSQTLNKLIKYQKAEFTNEEWLMNISFIATDDKWEIAEGTHNWAIENYTKKFGYTGVFPADNNPGGDQLYAITHRVTDAQVVSAMNAGRTIINYSGHGSTISWAGPNVSQSDVRGLSHQDAIPFVISNACITGNFTIAESFGETWIKHPQGAIMFWGSMDSSYWTEDDVLEKAMYRGIYENNFLHFSKITQYSLKEHFRHFGGAGKSKYYWETYVTFGDPSIRFRTTYSKKVKLAGPSILPFGVRNVTYHLTDLENRAIANARVAISILDQDIIYSGLTDETGKITLPTTGAEVGQKFTIKVYGDNLKTYTQELLITSSDTPYLIFSDYKYNGRPADQLYPFEEVNLGLTVKNVARVSTQGSKIILEKIEGPAEIVLGEINVPALGPNEDHVLNDNTLQIKVNDATNGATIILNFRWETEEGQSGTFQKVCKVIRGSITVPMIDFGDPGHPGDGGISPGGSGEIYLTIKNSGLAPIKNATITIEKGQCIEEISGEITIDLLNSGKSQRIDTPFRAHINKDCQNNDIAKIKLKGQYQGVGGEVSLASDGSFIVGRFGEIERAQNVTLPIKDYQTATYQFDIDKIDILKRLAIEVKITHTYIGDLDINLVHPDGTKVLLRKRSGGSVDNIHETYGHGGKEVPDLEKFMNKGAVGKWKLEIKDYASRDEGSLDFVRIYMRGLI